MPEDNPEESIPEILATGTEQPVPAEDSDAERRYTIEELAEMGFGEVQVRPRQEPPTPEEIADRRREVARLRMLRLWDGYHDVDGDT